MDQVPALQILDTRIAEHLAAILHTLIDIFQCAQAKLALALDTDDIGVWQLTLTIGLKTRHLS